MQKDKNIAIKRSILRALEKEMDRIFRSPHIKSFQNGRELICPYCNLSIKPCSKNKSAMCKEMIEGGTYWEILMESFENPEKLHVGKCILCGKPISPARLKKHPTAEFCASCAAKARKIRRKNI